MNEMEEKEPRIGVYVCHCGSNIEGIVDTAEVADFAGKLDNVIISRHYKFMCSESGQDVIKEDIKEHNLNRVIVASCSPRMHEPTFRRACREAGLNQYLFTMANIREQVSWVTTDKKAATEKSKGLISAAIRRAALLHSLPTREVDITPSAMVIGGGIAGISSALKLATGDIKVYLVEREPSIGGHMAYLDKTFPTLDCAACILTPKMVDVANNPNIEIMPYSEVEEVSGYVGNFTVKVRKKAKYVDLDLCTACDDCTEVCPVDVPDEFELGHTTRKAIYRMFPQAVPNTFIIEKKEPNPCKVACLIDQDAAGYVALVADGKYADAMKLIRRVNPLPAICGRVCYHPCEMACRRGKLDEPISIRYLKRFVYDWAVENNEYMEPPQVEKKGKKVAIIGSGPAGLSAAHDLALEGYESTIYESLPVTGGMMRVGIPRYRLTDEVLDREIDYIKKMGVDIKTSTTIGKDMTLSELRDKFDSVFIATGAHIGTTAGLEYEGIEGVYQGVDMLRKVNLGEKVDISGKVIVIGGGNTAMDAARVALRSGADSVEVVYRRTREQMPADPEEIKEAEDEGIKFTFLKTPFDFESDNNGVLKGLNVYDMELGEPDSSGRPRPVKVEGSEHIIDCDRVILAIGQKPDKSFNNDGLDLEFTDWDSLIVNEKSKTTNVEGVFAGGDNVRGPATVLEAIADGKDAAISIVRYLEGESFDTLKAIVPDIEEEEVEEDIDWREEYPEEPVKDRVKMPELTPQNRKHTFDEVMLGFTEEEAVKESERCLHCGVCVECRQCEFVCQPEAIRHDDEDEIVEVDVGAIVVATGYQLMDPTPMEQYGYGRYPDVITSLEFERLVNSAGYTEGKLLTSNGKKPESIAILHCIGSRDENYNEYCSSICCMYALKFSHLIKEKTDAEVYQLYIDMRCSGKSYEEFYHRLLSEDVRFIRGKGAEVTDFPIYPEEENKLIVRVEDTLVGEIRRIPVDMVVLCPAVEAREGAAEFGAKLGIGCTQDGFYLEKHPKLEPTQTASDGIFIAGACVAPKDIPYSVDQGAGAGAEALNLIVQGTVEVESATAEVMEELCSGCRICNTLCPYTAITFDEEKGVSVVNEALCKGCGTCVAACPSGAIIGKHFTDRQLLAEIEGVLI
jgi:heterodisulfide reductase subunit A